MMKGLTLYQPHASLVAVGAKPYETRGKWGYHHFGEVVVQAGKSTEDLDLVVTEPWRSALAEGRQEPASLPLGKAVCLADLVGVWLVGRHGLVLLRNGLVDRPVSDSVRPMPTGRAAVFGDFSLGRLLLELVNVRPLLEPVPVRGQQGLFDLTAAEEQAVRAAVGPPLTGAATSPAGVWRYFSFRQIREAQAHAAAGGIAVHHTGMPFRRWKFTAHLFAKDRDALVKAIRKTGADPKWIQYPGTADEHFDLMGKPLETAMAFCDREGYDPTREDGEDG